ncbi:MAG: hypothetical protein R3B07_05965 [Polyangiaceae bacterium]
MSLEESLQRVQRALHPCLKEAWPPLLEESEIRAKLGSVRGLDATLLQARVEKAAMTALTTKLESEPLTLNRFVDKPPLKWVAAVVTRARLLELSRVHIVRRASRVSKGYDISELAGSYYGRQVLGKLSFSNRRRVVDADEMATIKQAFAGIKLTLPEVVERTTTEKFFDPEET